MRLSKQGLVDTNILVYSVNLDSNFHQIKPSEIRKIVNFFSNPTKLPYLYPQEKTFQKAIKMALKTEGFGKQKVFDAYLAATCLENKISIIYTHNPKDFKPYKDITPIDPLKR